MRLVPPQRTAEESISSNLHFLLSKSLIRMSLPFFIKACASLSSLPTVSEIRIFSYLTHTVDTQKSQGLQLRHNVLFWSRQLAAGRQWLAFNSTRKSCRVFSLPSYQSSPFCYLDISDTVVLKTRYYIGHIVQISKSDGTQSHYITTANCERFFYQNF